MIANLVEYIKEEKLNFKEVEEMLFKQSLELFQHMMVEVLEYFDKNILENRDKERYKIKQINQRTIQTLVGEVNYKRRYYRDYEKDCWVHLLDETLGLEAEKSIGPGLLSLAVEWATKGPSYRDARDRIEDLYGFPLISHEGIRQNLLKVAAVSQRDAENKIITGEGSRVVDIIFIEVDGFYSHMQKQKQTKKQKRNKETKMAVIHEGWAPRTNSKKSDYKLVNKQSVTSTENAEEFWENVRGHLNANYKDIDKTLIVINGDGAPWIREGTNCFARTIYQYDRFHVARDILSALRSDKAVLYQAQRAFRKNDVGALLSIVTEAWVNCTDEEEKEKIGVLQKMLLKNHEYIVDYRVRLAEKGIAVNENWRGMGAAESNVNKFKNRTGKRGRAWSLEGLTAILETLSLHFRGNLRQAISRTLKEREEWFLDHLISGIGRVKYSNQKSHGGIRKGSFPAMKHGTQGYAKLFREISRFQFN